MVKHETSEYLLNNEIVKIDMSATKEGNKSGDYYLPLCNVFGGAEYFLVLSHVAHLWADTESCPSLG